MIDLMNMVAYIYHDDLGQNIEKTEIPADMLEEAQQRRARDGRGDRRDRRRADAALPRRRRDLDRRAEGGAARCDDQLRAGPGAVRHGAQEQGRAAHARRGGRLPAVAARCPAGHWASTRRPKSRKLRPTDPDAPFAALAFKIVADPFVGKLAFIRVYSGKLEAGSYVLQLDQGRARAHRPPAPDARQPPRGDRGGRRRRHRAVVGLKSTFTGDTLCDPDKPIVLESITFPEPVIEVAIEPKTRADQDKMGMALARLAEEDPTFRVRTDEETGQTIIVGMGELHLEVIVDRMLREFKVEANVGKPQVAYRETITTPVTRRRPLRAPDRRPGSVRSCLARARAAGAGRGLRLRGQDRRRLGPARVHPGRRARASRKRWRPAATAGYPVVDIKVDAGRRLVPRG